MEKIIYVVARPALGLARLIVEGNMVLRSEMEAAYAYPLRAGKADVGLRKDNEDLADAYPFLR